MLTHLLARLGLVPGVEETHPPHPVAHDDQAGEDEEDEEVLQSPDPSPIHQTTLSNQQTQSNTYINISEQSSLLCE